MRALKKRAQFLRAARGRKSAERGFVLQAVPVSDPEPGIGFTVTKKVGNAPERNRIRRRLRAVAKACEDRFVAGHDYVLIGRRASLNEPFDALVRDLAASIDRVHTTRPRPSGREDSP